MASKTKTKRTHAETQRESTYNATHLYGSIAAVAVAVYSKAIYGTKLYILIYPYSLTNARAHTTTPNHIHHTSTYDNKDTH